MHNDRYVNFHDMLFGLHSMTSVPNTQWDGKIFFSRSSHAQFVGDLIFPRAGMDFEVFHYSIQTQLQMFLQRNLTEGAFSTQDPVQRVLMFSMKHIQRNFAKFDHLLSPDDLQSESMRLALQLSSRSCTPCHTPPSLSPGLWIGDQGAMWRHQSPVGFQGAKLEAVEEDVAASMEKQQCVARLETSVKKSGIDANACTKLTAEDKMSKIMDEKLASLEAKMMENIGRLLKAVNDNILKEQQVRHPSFPTRRERERQCSCKIRASAFQLTSFALCTLCLSLCLICHLLVLFLGLP
jgi:hypothetical protein